MTISPTKLAGILRSEGADPGWTDFQLLECVRNVVAQRDHWKEVAQGQPWRTLPLRWEKVDVGAMIEHDGKVWIVLERCKVEGRKVKARLWRGGKTFQRFPSVDDVVTVLEPTAQIDALKLLRAELGVEMMTPEDAAVLRERLAAGDVAGAA